MPDASKTDLGASRGAAPFDPAMALELGQASMGLRLIFSAIFAAITLLILPWMIPAAWFAALVAWELAASHILRRTVPGASVDRAMSIYAVINLTGTCLYHVIALVSLASGSALGVAIGATWLGGAFMNNFVYFGSDRRLLWPCLGPAIAVTIVGPMLGHGPTVHGALISALILSALAAARRYALDHHAVLKTLADRQVALVDLERKLYVAVEASGDGLFEVDVRSGALHVNPTWSAMLGYGPGELASPIEDWQGVVHPDDELRLRQEFEAHFAGETPHTGCEVRLKCKDGSFKWVLSRARLIERTPEGEPWRAVGTTVDLSTHKALETQLGAARDLAESANAAKSAFIANMSHEIRTPLNGVIGVAGALARTRLGAGQREMVGLIQSSGQVLERLLGDILDQAKIESGKLQVQTAPFDLREEIEAAAELMRARAEEKGVAFRVAYPDAACGCFEGDAVRIRQIVSNLASNAIKFTQAGEVSITVEAIDRDEAPTLVRIAVADTGIGFDREAAGRLFGRFVQADGSISRQFGGTGLGLSICKCLTEMMHGRIEAASEPGVGSVFTVELPLRRTVAHTPRVATAEQAPCLDGLKILMAEDHPINQRVVQLILGPMGVDLTIVGNGQEAVEAFETAAFDLILMDMQMPVMDGLSATRGIRERERLGGRAATPIAMFTANAKDEHRAMATEAGADHHIAKPITPEGLIAGIERALAQVPWSSGEVLAPQAAQIA